MADKIPQYQRQGNNDQRAYTPRLDTSLPRNSGIGEGLSDIGDAAVRLGNMGAQAYIQKQRDIHQKQEKFDSLQAIRVFSEFQIKDQERQYNFQNQYAGDPGKYAQSNLEDLDKFYRGFTTEPMSQGAMDKLSSMYEQYKVQSHAKSVSYQAAAKGAEVKRNWSETVDNLVNHTRINPYTSYWDNLGKIQDMVETFKGQIPDAELDILFDQSKDKLGLAMIRGKGDQDPRKTIEEWKNGVYNEILSPEAIESVMPGLMREIESEDRQKAAHLRAEIAGQMDDHFASLMSTNTPVLSRAQVQYISELSKDPELLRDYDFRTKVGRQYYTTLHGSESLPLDDQLAMVEKLKPTPGSKNFAEEERAFETLKDTVVGNFKDYQQDKVAYMQQHNNDVRKAFERSPQEGRRAVLTSQLNKGTPLDRLQIASQEEIGEYNFQVNQMLENGQFDQAKKYMSDLKSEYNVAELKGKRTGWDILKNQLINSKTDKIPTEFLLSLQYEDIPEGREIFNAYTTPDSDFKTLLGEQRVKNISARTDAVFSSYASVVSKIPGMSTKVLANEKNLLNKYALRLVQQGVPEKEAARQAFKTMYQYDVIDNNKQKLIIPKGMGNLKIDSTKINLKLDDLRYPGSLESHFQLVSGSAAKTFGLVPLSINDNTGGGKLYLRSDAAQSLEDVQAGLKSIQAPGIKINSALRSRAEQQKLYDKLHGISPVAKPGSSLHEQGLAIDVQNYNDPKVKQYLLANGWSQPLSKTDPVHFVYTGSKAYGSVPNRFTSKSENKMYIDALSKDGVWISDPGLRSVSLYSKNRDGSLTRAVNAAGKPYSFSLDELQHSKLAQRALPVKAITDKSPINKSAVAAKRAQQTRVYSSQLSGKTVERDDEAKFIMERGF